MAWGWSCSNLQPDWEEKKEVNTSIRKTQSKKKEKHKKQKTKNRETQFLPLDLSKFISDGKQATGNE